MPLNSLSATALVQIVIHVKHITRKYGVVVGRGVVNANQSLTKKSRYYCW